VAERCIGTIQEVREVDGNPVYVVGIGGERIVGVRESELALLKADND